jgi:hypothetical protein
MSEEKIVDSSQRRLWTVYTNQTRLKPQRGQCATDHRLHGLLPFGCWLTQVVRFLASKVKVAAIKWHALASHLVVATVLG